MSSGPAQSGVAGIGVTVALTVISTGFVILRFWSRSITKFGLWLDDWLALATLVTMYWTLVISIWAVVRGGLGKPLLQAMTENPNAVLELLKLLYAFEFVYLLASPLMKLTVLAYYWRMFPSRSIRWGIQILTGVCVAWFVSILVANLVQCQPISRFWNLTGEGFCRFPAAMYSVGVAIPNSVIDFLTVLLPIYEVWHLKLSMWKRIGVCAIFGIGGIVVIASVVRLSLLIWFRHKGEQNLSQDLLLPWFSTAVEIATAIVGSCLPCLMPLYRKIRYGNPDSRPGYGYHSSQRSHGNNPTNPKSISGKLGGRKPLASRDDGGPFERIDTLSASRDTSFGPTSPQLYVVGASGNRPPGRSDRASTDDDIPLQGISVVHEVTVMHTTHGSTWLDTNKP